MNTAETLVNQQLVPLNLIQPNNYNARNFDNMSPQRQRSFDELVNSISEKGVIQPIVLRPLANGQYEVVAGERRFRASKRVAELRQIPLDSATIPAIINQYSDDEALEIMAIENIQRDDFTPMEEADFFAAQIEKMGHTPDTYKILAKSYGLEEAAIRLRVALRTLPDPIKNAYDAGTITIGHAELFCKISDPEFQLTCFNSCVANRWSIKDLNLAIKASKPKIKFAKFATDPCRSCLNNSSLQRQLFETDEEAVCLHPDCFRKKQFSFFEQNWKGSKGQELFKTNGFRFHDDLEPAETFAITTDEIHQRCTDCPEFVTAGTLAGGRVEGKERVCIGDKKCYEKCYAASKKEEKTEIVPNNQKEHGKNETISEEGAIKAKSDPAAEEKRAKERAKQRGTEQREKLYTEQLPKHISALEPTSPPAVRIALIALLLSNRDALQAVKKLDSLTNLSPTPEVISKAIIDLPKEHILTVLREAATGTVMATQGDGSPEVRHQLAQLVGIDIASHWILNKEYLKKLTKEEIVRLGEEPQMNLWSDDSIKSYKEKEYGKKGWMSLKKQSLIDCILKSGADIKGKIPAEIQA